MKNKKVLVADDEAHIRHIVSLKLENAGYEVITAADGEEALELCASERPDMVITDYQMPYMSGLEFCSKLHCDDRMKDIPTVMLTARGFDISPEQRESAGVSTILAKPFSPREILSIVNELLAGADEPSTADVSE